MKHDRFSTCAGKPCGQCVTTAAAVADMSSRWSCREMSSSYVLSRLDIPRHAIIPSVSAH